MSENKKDKKAFEALGYIPKDAPKNPKPPSKNSSTKPDHPEGPPTIPPGGADDETVRLRMNSEDFETEFGPEAHREDETKAKARLLDPLPSGPIQVLKLLFVDQVRDEYDDGGEYQGSKFIPTYIAVESFEITVPVLAYVKLKDRTQGGDPVGKDRGLRGSIMVEVEARIKATVEISSDDLDWEMANFREALILALSNVDNVKAAEVEILKKDGSVLSRARFAKDPEARRGEG